MDFAFFHGEANLPNVLIKGFTLLVASYVLIFGLRKYKSRIGAYVVIAYFGLVLITALIYAQFSNPLIESIASMLTLPWSLILPCSYMVHSCSLSPGAILVSAVLNAAIIYLLVAAISRRRRD